MFRNTFSIGFTPPAFQSRDYFNFLRTINNTSSTDDYQTDSIISSTDLISSDNNNNNNYNVEFDNYIDYEDRSHEDVSLKALESNPPQIIDDRNINLYKSLKQTEDTSVPATYTYSFVDKNPKLLSTRIQDNNQSKELEGFDQYILDNNHQNNEVLVNNMIHLQVQQQQKEYESYKQRLFLVELMQAEYMVLDEVQDQVENYFQLVQQQLQAELQQLQSPVIRSQILPQPLAPIGPSVSAPPSSSLAATSLIPPPPLVASVAEALVPPPPPLPPDALTTTIQKAEQNVIRLPKRKEIPESSTTSSTSKRKKTEVKINCCHICLREFKRSYNLNEHIRTHDKDRVKRYPCERCGKAFDRTHDLKRHAKSCKK